MKFESMIRYYRHKTDVKMFFCLLLILLSLFDFPAVTKAEDTNLEQGIKSYEYGDYDNSIKSLKQMDEVSASGKTRTLMHLYLALDYYAKGMTDSMNKELKSLYLADPDFTPNPVIVPPTVISAYNKIKQKTVLALPVPVKEKDGNYWWRIVPFGIGQFSKGDNKKGTILLIAETTELAVNIATYYVRKSKENSDGSYNNPVWAGNMQVVQLAAFWLFVGTASYGIADAFLWKVP